MAQQTLSAADKRATEFTIDWPDAEASRRTWVWDSMHHPYPLTPLSIEFTERIYLRMGGFGVDTPVPQMASIWPHGYLYRLMGGGAGAAAAPGQAARARQRAIAQQAQHLRAIWRRDYLPPMRVTLDAIRRTDYESMSVAELAARIDGLLDSAADAFAQTLRITPAMFECSRPFLDLCTREFGDEGESQAALMMQGFANESSAVEIALWELAERARRQPAVARAIHEQRFEGLLDTPRVRGGASFMEALQQYLDRYGRRPDFWFELSQPTWREQPRLALRALRRYLTADAPNPRDTHARSARRRGQAVRRARSLLRANPRTLDRFNRLLRTAQQHVPVSEERALWQLTTAGHLRAPLLALGGKLVRAGVLDAAEGIFYLHLGEIREIAAGEGPAGRQQLVAVRQRERERWADVIPPRTIGAPLDRSMQTALASRFMGGGGDEQNGDERVLTGAAASAGVARGRAKVVHTLAEADKVERGDILVCRSTSPAWTPLFSRVAAVAADSGGVLSHCAIVAREYALPCVVGLGNASQRIRDGMLITVDGGQGLVRLEGDTP